MAANGAPEGLIVQADTQTAGRGRLNRQWESPTGLGLWFSIVLRPPLNGREIALSPFFASIAVAQTLKNYNMRPELKWPNDVLLNGKKTCGILAETAWHGDELNGLVLGIGINILPPSVPSSREINFPATCIQAHADQPINRLFFLRSVLACLFETRKLLIKDSFIQRYQNYLAYINEEVILETIREKKFRGTLIGIDSDGCLQLRMQNGHKKRFPSGDLHLRPT